AQFCRLVPRRTLSLAGYDRLVAEQAGYRQRFRAALDAGRFDALLCPANGLPALPHGCRYGGLACSYNLLFNVLGMPAGGPAPPPAPAPRGRRPAAGPAPARAR